VELHVRKTFVAAVSLGVVAVACAGPVIGRVGDGTYRALVPSSEQFAADAAADIPGGFVVLRDAEIDEVEVSITGDDVTFRLNGVDAVTLRVMDRIEVRDSEGSGPFKAEKEVLVLGDAALVLGELIIVDPAVWPGSFEESPVVTIKPWNLDERGPGVSCGADEDCLLLSSGVDPTGRYENANDPSLDESPVASIEVADQFVEFTLDTGQQFRTSRESESSTRTCGLSATAEWDVPIEVGLGMADPVLVHTLCPSNPGAAIRLVIMERTEIPVLAPLSTASDGEWCRAGPACLWFVPI
jgi:hypothetical protein